jgi:Rieske Fe-S protein
MPRQSDGDTPSQPASRHENVQTSRAARAQESAENYQRGFERQEWRAEFPYEWREDDLVTRRDTLRFLVAGTGALFLATGALALTGSVRSSVANRYVPIARVGELAPGQSKAFNYPNSYLQGILINLPDKGLVCYSDVCTHLSCAVLYQPKEKHLYCPCHDGVYDAGSGDVLAGPPTRPLPLIEIQVMNGIVYAVREVER